jgi:hypothetical protein
MGGEPKFAPGWHKDNRLGDRANPRGLDWTTKRYPIIRFGVYFQDHARYSGGLALRVGSNHAARVDRGKPINVSTEAGDVVVWTLTTTHSGQANRLTFLRNRAVGGRWMRFLPKRFLIGEEQERIAAFLTLASDSPHLTRYIEHLKTERAHDEMEWFRKSRFDDGVWQRAKEAGLTVRRIIPEYGTP